jgi:hypothetical protein
VINGYLQVIADKHVEKLLSMSRQKDGIGNI